MATIKAGGLSAKDAPSPVLLQTWHDSWNPFLAGLTAWAGNADKTEYTCTTTSTVAVTRGVAETDLQTWVEQDPGHRHYSIT